MGIASTSAPATIRPDEADHFGRLAADWWDPKGASAMLHRLNPVRLRFIRRLIDIHFGIDRAALRPLSGRRALDVGCGAGLVAEPLARMGATVTGVDAAPENIRVAHDHAARAGLSIRYLAGEIGALDLGARFDLITALEVIEHVADPAAFVDALVDRLAPDGLLILSTPNRTILSRALLVDLAEATRRIPRGTHDWTQFITPDELTAMLAARGLAIIEMKGISFDPVKGLSISDNLALNYILGAVRA